MSIRIPTVAENFFFAQLHVYIVGEKFMRFNGINFRIHSESSL